MAPPRLLFDLNEAPSEEDIEDHVATACEDSQSQSQPQPQPHLDVDNGGEGDGSTARGLPSPPPPKDDSTGGSSAESEPLLPVLDLDAPLSPLDDDDEEEEDDDLPRPPDDPDGARSPGPSHSERMATDRSTASHAEAATLTTPCSHADDDGAEGPVHASRHGVTTSPRTTTSLPDCHGTKTLSQAFSARSSPETVAARVHGSHMPRRDKPPSVPRDDYGESSHGGSRLFGSPSTSHHERSMRSHPYAMHSEGTPRNNNKRRPRRPMRQGYNGHDQRQQVNSYSHDQRQVYGNGQDQRQKLNNNGRDQRHQVYNNGHDQRQQVYNNGQDQWRQGHHGYRTPEGGQGHGYSAPNRQRQQQQQGYSSGRPSAGGQYAGEDSYGSRQIPANQQPFRGQQRHVVKPYHPYARGVDASDDRANAGKQARHEHREQQQQQHRVYQQHRRNRGPARRRQYYGDLYN